VFASFGTVDDHAAMTELQLDTGGTLAAIGAHALDEFRAIGSGIANISSQSAITAALLWASLVVGCLLCMT